MPTETVRHSTLEDLVGFGVATEGGAARRVATNFIDIDATQSAGQLWPVHSHVEHELLWGITGGLTVTTPTASHVVPRGLALWIPADVPHEVHASGGTAVACTWWAVDLTSGPGPEVRGLSLSRLLADTLRHLEEAALDDVRRERAERFAADLLATPDDRCPDRSVPLPLSLPLPRSLDLRAVATAILDDPADPSTLTELAAASGLSLRTLTRRFQAETGMAPAQWRTRARMGAATRALALGVPPTRVARQTGFATPSAFGAAFRRHTGISPRSWAGLATSRPGDGGGWPDRDSC